MALPIITISGQTFQNAISLVKLPDPLEARPNTDGLAIHHSGVAAPYFSTPEAEQLYITTLSDYDTTQWGSSSYHAYAFPSGNVYVIGDGTMVLPDVAYENQHLEGICLVGDYSCNPVTPAQIGNVAKWILAKWKQHRFMPVKGHRDWVNLVLHPTWATACPGDKGVASIDTMLRVVEAIARCP